MNTTKPQPVYHRCQILMGETIFDLWIDCNDDFAKSLAQKYNPSCSLELMGRINDELGREAAKLA